MDRACSMDIGMQLGNGYNAAWTWSCSMDMDTRHAFYWDMQDVLEFAELAWICSVDMDMQHGHEHGLAACTVGAIIRVAALFEALKINFQIYFICMIYFRV